MITYYYFYFKISLSSSQCYEFDKFEAYETEEAAVSRGMDLLNGNQLWAVIIFQDGSNITNQSDRTPTHIKYKIR